MKVKKNRVTFEITGIVDVEEAKRFLRQNGFEIVSESLDTQRSRTPHETDTKQICPSCFGSGELHTLDHARLVCNRCGGTGHI